MSIVVGIYCSDGIFSKIAIYNPEIDDVEYRLVEFLDYEKVILNLKAEFGEKLLKICVTFPEHQFRIPEIDSKDESLIYFMSNLESKISLYFSAKINPTDKIIKYKVISNTIRCNLFKILFVKNNIFYAKEIKYFQVCSDEIKLNEIVIKVFKLKPNETHVIYEDTKDESFISKITKNSKIFCSFTKNIKRPIIERPENDEHHKAMTYARFLVKDQNVQSIIYARPNIKYKEESNIISGHKWNLNSRHGIPIIAPRPINTYESHTRLMGIDLGTSRCVVCISRNKSTGLVKIDQEYSMPTVISFDEQEPIIGSVALRKLKNQSKSVLFDIKRITIAEKSNWPRGKQKFDMFWPFGICKTPKRSTFVVHHQEKITEYSSRKIQQMIFQKLKNAASEYQADLNNGKFVNQAVITVPGYDQKYPIYGHQMILNITKAALSSGIKIIDIIKETHADLLYFLSKYDLPNNRNVVVVDIGGGTGYIQSYRISELKAKKNGQRFLLNCYGRKIDEILIKRLRKLLLEEYNVDIRTIEYFKLFPEVERIKHILSFDETVYMNLPNLKLSTNDLIKVTRNWFEKNVLEPFFVNSEKITVIQTLYTKRVSNVFLVGGCCRIPYIQKFFKSIFGEKKVVIADDIEHITATGALIHGLQVLNDEIEPLFKIEKLEKELPSKCKSDESSDESTNEELISKNKIDSVTISEIMNLNINGKVDNNEKLLLPPK